MSKVIILHFIQQLLSDDKFHKKIIIIRYPVVEDVYNKKLEFCGDSSTMFAPADQTQNAIMSVTLSLQVGSGVFNLHGCICC